MSLGPLYVFLGEVSVIYTMEFYAAERKKELIPFATAWMKLESKHYAK